MSQSCDTGAAACTEEASGLTLPDMSDITRIRWYRAGLLRGLGVLLIIMMGAVTGPLFLILGLSRSSPGVIVLAVVIILADVAGVVLARRAGIGVTPEHVLIRGFFPWTQAIPWAQVAGFEIGRTDPKNPKSGETVFVVTTSGKRHTPGCSPAGLPPLERWQLLRALEDARLAWAPGSASTVPVQPPEPEPGVPPQRRMPVIVLLSVILLMAGAGYAVYGGAVGLGPAIQAARGAGTVGYFIPHSESCGRSCSWTGNFRLPDGSVTRRNVRLYDATASAVKAGVPVAARDTGGDGVFPRADPGAWGNWTVLVYEGCWGIVMLPAPFVLLWRRRARFTVS